MSQLTSSIQEPLDIVQYILEHDEVITNNISNYNDYPAVFQEFAEADAKYPYIVLRNESTIGEENELLDKSLISVDIFVQNNRSKARNIRNRIRQLFFNKQYDSFEEGIEQGAVMSYLRGTYQPEQPDKTIKCEQVKVVLRTVVDGFYYA